MPIEFHCTQCGLRLRTADDTAGKQARCPHCGTLVPIPLSSEPDVTPTGDPTVPDPFQPAPSQPTQDGPANPFADPPLVNPYQATGGPWSGSVLSPAETKAKLVGPAVGMIVTAVLSIAYAIVNLVTTLVLGIDQLGAQMPNDPAVRAALPIILVVMYALFLIPPILVLLGAVSMLRVKSYALAKTGAILSLVPCSCCFLISIPFGIWALIVLNNPQVRSAFQSDTSVKTEWGEPGPYG